jgi:anthranilate phosphoribosyltransferase
VTIRDAIAALTRRRSLSQLEMMSVVEEMMDGRAAPAQIGGFLLALRMKGESVDELCGAARALRQESSSTPAARGVTREGRSTFRPPLP